MTNTATLNTSNKNTINGGGGGGGVERGLKNKTNFCLKNNNIRT